MDQDWLLLAANIPITPAQSRYDYNTVDIGLSNANPLGMNSVPPCHESFGFKSLAELEAARPEVILYRCDACGEHYNGDRTKLRAGEVYLCNYGHALVDARMEDGMDVEEDEGYESGEDADGDVGMVDADSGYGGSEDEMMVDAVLEWDDDEEL
jgi:hypothetical protein